MTIAPLSDAAARTILSTATLNDPCSVVKELVDNALDSHASSVLIEISADTLDVIQVKDNGIGIGVEDRQLLCKRGCTSKIETLDDLQKLGGTSLGFRGEALASIADLSASVSITTRVEGEVVGSTLKYGQRGELVSSSSASHPVGTTVRVQNLFTSVPVRKQVLTTATATIKTLTEIKKLLLSYAFTRITTRFALKVLKAKSDKSNWSYAACGKADQLLAAAAKIAGKDAAVLCKQYSCTLKDDTVSVESKSSYNVHAVLVDSGHLDLSKVGGVGQYVSVDNRPITVERGMGRELVKMYRSYIQSAVDAAVTIPAKPFLCLQLHCPTASYDVNVEPTKNEVLFHNVEHILNLAKQLFTECYGVLETDKEMDPKTHLELQKTKVTSSFDVLLARKRNEGNPVSFSSPEIEKPARIGDCDDFTSTLSKLSSTLDTHNTSPGSNGARGTDSGSIANPFRNMYGVSDGDEDVQSSSMPGLPLHDNLDHLEPQDASTWIRNPFTTAKLHAHLPIKKLHSTDDGASPSTSSRKNRRTAEQDCSIVSSPQMSGFTLTSQSSNSGVAYLPTPSKSPIGIKPYQNPGPPLRRRQYHLDESDGSDMNPDDAGCSTAMSHGRPDILESWTKLTTGGSTSSRQTTARMGYGTERCSDANPAQMIPISGTSNDSNETTVSRATDSHGPAKMSIKPFRSPLKANPDSMARNSPTESSSNLQYTSTSSGHGSPVRQNLTSASATELDQIMEFEHRKRALNQGRKALRSQSETSNRLPFESGLTRLAPADLDMNILGEEGSRQSEGIQGDFASNFGGSVSTEQPQRSNPHRNRYLAATRTLDLHRPANSRHSADSAEKNHSIPGEAQDGDPIHQPRIGMPTIDPKANLPTDTGHLIGTTSKPKRAKSAHLPLENIPPRALKHNVLATSLNPPLPDTISLPTDCRLLSVTDRYVRTGKNDFVTWSPFSDAVGQWEKRLKDLVRTSYRAGQQPVHEQRGKDNNRNDEDEGTVPGIEISLGRAIKEHIATMT